MRRLVALVVLITACADASGSIPSTLSVPGGDSETSTTLPDHADAGSGGATTTVVDTLETCVTGEAPTDPSAGGDTDREIAPNFTLAMADGACYILSETSKPVYLVFWAEWCPTCRGELPVVDRVAADYADRVDFVAPVWKSGEAAAIEAAATLFRSGQIKWGMDNEEVIFGLYGVPYQPVTVLIATDRTVVEAWPGVRSESQIRSSLDDLIALSS